MVNAAYLAMDGLDKIALFHPGFLKWGATSRQVNDKLVIVVDFFWWLSCYVVDKSI